MAAIIAALLRGLGLCLTDVPHGRSLRELGVLEHHRLVPCSRIEDLVGRMIADDRFAPIQTFNGLVDLLTHILDEEFGVMAPPIPIRGTTSQDGSVAVPID